jgi:hypothetical protein
VTAARVALALTLAAAVVLRFDAAASAAESRLRVVIVIDESDDPFAERIRAEVSALGFEVVTVEPWRTGEPVESLDAAGRANQAAAAIRMVASRKGVEVWVANQPTGRSLLRQLIVDEQPGAPNEGLVALQTAELLRTTLLSRSDLPAASPRLPPAVAPPTIATPAGPPPPPSGALQAATGVLYSPGAGNVAWQFWLTLSHVIRRPVGIALDVSGPARASTITGPEGTATIGAWLAGASLTLDYEPGDGLYGRAALGAAAIRLTADGSAADPLVASSRTVTSGAAYARADGGFQVAWWLRLGVRGVAGVIPGGIAVHFAGNDAGTWGRPFLAGMAVADIAWR